MCGANVLTAADLADAPDLIALYDGIRAIPQIADGIRCQCGCAPIPGCRSLLACFQQGGMAMHCQICQTDGLMIVRLHGQGRSLAQIRAAVDASRGRGPLVGNGRHVLGVETCRVARQVMP